MTLSTPCLAPPKKVIEFVAHAGQVNAVTLDRQMHSLVATGGDDNIINVWRIDNAANLASLKGDSSPVNCLASDPISLRFVAGGYESGAIKIFDVASGKVSRSLPGHAEGVTCINYDTGAGMLISGSLDTSFKVWDMRTKKCAMHHKGHQSEVTDAQISPDGRWCCSSGNDGIMNLWDMRNRETIYSFELETTQGQASPILHFSFHPTQSTLATYTKDYCIRLFNTDSFELLASPPRRPLDEKCLVGAMVFDGRGRLLTSTSSRMQILSDSTLETQGTIDAPWTNLQCLSWKDGEILGAAFDNNIVSLYSITLGTPAESMTPVSITHQKSNNATANGALSPASASLRLKNSTSPVTSLASLRSSHLSAVALPSVTAEQCARKRLSPSPALPKQSVSQVNNKDHVATQRAANLTNHGKENKKVSAHMDRDGRATINCAHGTKIACNEMIPIDFIARQDRADGEIIFGTMLHRKVLMTALSVRLENLQRLNELWRAGKVPETFGLLFRLHQATPEDQGRLTVLSDFLQTVDLLGCASEHGPLSLETAAPLLPVLNSLLSLDFEGPVLAGIKTLMALLDLLGTHVQQVLRTPLSGVDLTREERVERCRKFNEAISYSFKRLEEIRTSNTFKAASPAYLAVERAGRRLESYLAQAVADWEVWGGRSDQKSNNVQFSGKSLTRTRKR